MRVATCGGCSLPIRWVKTAKGKAMPLDYALTATDEARIVLYALDGKRVTGTGMRTGYQPHWGSCVARKQFTKTKATVAIPDEEIPF